MSGEMNFPEGTMPISTHNPAAPYVASIAPELVQVDQLFMRELASDLDCVKTLVKHVARFRGKMLRPCLVLLAGKAVGNTSDAHVTIATVVEMVHMATLVHDDVLDDAELRRKGATINHLRGNEAAVMLGDYLISHSYHLCASLDSQYASRQIAHTTNVVCEGELLQISNRNNFELGEDTYLTIIERKTASLIATSCALGAYFGGAGEQQIEALRTYGRCMGVAFQIQDDLLDILGDAAEVGKTLGLDVEKGKMTLPMIHFMATAPKEHRELLRSLLVHNDADKADRIRNLILPSDSIAYARKRAGDFVDEAIAAVMTLPESPVRDALVAMAKFVVARGV
jgi:octaprenyl-diphosphate synthase